MPEETTVESFSQAELKTLGYRETEGEEEQEPEHYERERQTEMETIDEAVEELEAEALAGSSKTTGTCFRLRTASDWRAPMLTM